MFTKYQGIKLKIFTCGMVDCILRLVNYLGVIMKKYIVIILLSLATAGCQSTSEIKEVVNQTNYTIEESALENNSGAIVIDKLEGNFYYTGTDYDDFLLGNAYHKIRFTAHPGDKSITVTTRTMQQSWINADSVSIYIGKTKIIDKSGFNRHTNTSIVDGGSSSNTVYTHEYFDNIISIDNAKLLASSDNDLITLRFHTKQGYVDEKVHPLAGKGGLEEVVELLGATSLTKM
jgi:hypothetical protein